MTLTEEEKQEFLAQVLARIGDREAAFAESQRGKADAMWLSANYRSLIDRYENRWVAVHNKQVCADAADLDELLAILDAGPIHRKFFNIRFIQRHHRRLIM